MEALKRRGRSLSLKVGRCACITDCLGVPGRRGAAAHIDRPPAPGRPESIVPVTRNDGGGGGIQRSTTACHTLLRRPRKP